MLGWHLGDFKQADVAIIIDNGTTLDVSPGLVRQLHQKFSLAVGKVLQDGHVDIGAKVVNIGDENVLLAGSNELLKQARVLESIKDVTVTGGIPLALVAGGRARNGQEAFAPNTGVARLVEGEDLDIVVGVFLDDALGIVVRVERIHKDKWNIDLILRIEMLFEMINTCQIWY